MRTRTAPSSPLLLALSAECTTIDITYNFVPTEAQAAIEHAAGMGLPSFPPYRSRRW